MFDTYGILSFFDFIQYFKKAYDWFVNGTSEFEDDIYTSEEIDMPNKRPLVTNIMKISDLKKLLKPGDMVEFESYILGVKAYGHWGLFLGIKNKEYIIIHLSRELLPIKNSSKWYQLSNILQQNEGEMSIHLTSLENAAYSEQTGRINNYLDSIKTPNSARHIRRIANKAVKREPDYCLISNNCEHFVTELRYNEKISLQSKPIQKLLDFCNHIAKLPYNYLTHKNSSNI
uniref:LRAT domain-containing protein n=1 Tax=Strongyloides papillosus TaxID=174720 RepID=A0A0N5B3K8_STREA